MARTLLNRITEESKELLIKGYFKEQKREHHPLLSVIHFCSDPSEG